MEKRQDGDGCAHKADTNKQKVQLICAEIVIGHFDPSF